MTQPVRTDFHCHTIFSKDSLTSIEKLLETCQKKGIDRIVITDHNTIAGALIASRLNPRCVIVGEEIKTKKGELLAFFVQEEVPSGLSPQETIDRLRQQGAFISVSHPFDSARNGAWNLEDLKAITPQVDAIEVFNSRCAGNRPNLLAQVFAAQNHLAGTVGSDAHMLWEIGRATLTLPDFKNADDLRRSLVSAQSSLKLSPAWVHIASSYARYKKKRMGSLF
jgi:predicted metal-dependent phosphoesterase TrpH